MKFLALNEREVRTVLSVFTELKKKSYDELNCFLGSLTIEEMYSLETMLRGWFYDSETEEMA